MKNTKNRREFLRDGALLAASAAVAGIASQPAQAIEPIERNGSPRIKLSCAAYSYRKFLTGKNKTMTLDDFLDKCAEIGFDGVELTSYYFPSPITPEYLHHLKRKAFLLGLDVSGTAVGNNFCAPPGQKRDGQIARVKKWIDYAVEFGAPCMRVFAGGVPKGSTLEGAQKWVVECLEACGAHAAERGVFLALENHGGVTAAADQILAIVKAVKSDWVGINLDTGNFRSKDPYTDIAKAAPYAVTSHLKTEVRPTGKPKSEADFKKIVDIFRKANYRGYLSIEYEGREDPMTAIPRYVKQLRELVGLETG